MPHRVSEPHRRCMSMDIRQSRVKISSRPAEAASRGRQPLPPGRRERWLLAGARLPRADEVAAIALRLDWLLRAYDPSISSSTTAVYGALAMAMQRALWCTIMVCLHGRDPRWRWACDAAVTLEPASSISMGPCCWRATAMRVGATTGSLVDSPGRRAVG